MAKNLIQRVKGTRDFYPDDWATQRWLQEQFLSVGRAFGYREYETSLIEYADLYRGKSSDEIVNEQTFHLQVRDGNAIVLRPELTPSLARMIAAEEGRMAFPARWQAYGRFFRYERPQRGRGREFFQWNVDLLGADSPAADAEIITIACALFRRLGLSPEHVVIRVNDRRALDHLLSTTIGIPPDRIFATFALIDRMEKLGPEKFPAALRDAGLTDIQAGRLLEALESPEPAVSDWLKRVLELVDASGQSAYVTTDLRIVRGFDYYTRTVFEAWAKTSLRRALFGGGRYDNLTLKVGGKRQVPGVGFGAGEMPLTDLLVEVGLAPEVPKSSVSIYVTVFSDDLLQESTKLAQRLRAAGFSAEMHLDPAQRIDRQFRHADRQGIRFVALAGPDEVRAGTLTVKDLATGEQTSGPERDMYDRLKTLLSTKTTQRQLSAQKP